MLTLCGCAREKYIHFELPVQYRTDKYAANKSYFIDTTFVEGWHVWIYHHAPIFLKQAPSNRVITKKMFDPIYITDFFDHGIFEHEPNYIFPLLDSSSAYAQFVSQDFDNAFKSDWIKHEKYQYRYVAGKAVTYFGDFWNGKISDVDFKYYKNQAYAPALYFYNDTSKATLRRIEEAKQRYMKKPKM